MILQKILFPTPEICEDKELYFHMKNNKMHADTYFNSFSIGKWKKYTNLFSLFLVLQVKGSMKIEVYHLERQGTRIRKQSLLKSEITEDNSCIEIPKEVFSGDRFRGVIAFSLEKKTSDARLSGGWYEGECKTGIQNCHLAIDICTFKREEYVKRNILLLKKTLLPTGNVEIYVADNGQTLDKESLSNDKIHIYPNKNVGGVGGFTRGMIEALRDARATHVLIMDDDAIINPYAIEKMMAFLSMRKEDYKDMTVGGAMFLLGAPYMQYEAGAAWTDLRIAANHKILDMREPIKVLLNEEEDQKIEYFAWWFCCMPMTMVTETNLPLPIFVHKDDIEYGLRNCRTMVILNGVSVWHEDFDSKFSGIMEYYDQRNDMLVAALHKPNVNLRLHKKIMCNEIIRNMMKLRYRYAYMRLRGAEDFLRGIDWLMAQDGEILHREIMAMNYKMQPIEKLGITRDEAERNSQARSWRTLEIKSVSKRQAAVIQTFRVIKSYIKQVCFSITFNGLLFPAKKKPVIAEPNPSVIKFFRAGTAIHYDLNGKAYVTKRSLKEVIHICKEYRRVSKMLDRNFDRVCEEYRKRYKELTSLEFWREYLEI